PSAPYSPLALGPGESGTIAVTILPTGRAGTSVQGFIGSVAGAGEGLAPNDAAITSTWSTITARSIACRKYDVSGCVVCPKTLSATRLAPGATPRTRTLHPGGSGCAGLTICERSRVG